MKSSGMEPRLAPAPGSVCQTVRLHEFIVLRMMRKQGAGPVWAGPQNELRRRRKLPRRLFRQPEPHHGAGCRPVLFPGAFNDGLARDARWDVMDRIVAFHNLEPVGQARWQPDWGRDPRTGARHR